jgi:hypothetical protein
VAWGLQPAADVLTNALHSRLGDLGKKLVLTWSEAIPAARILGVVSKRVCFSLYIYKQLFFQKGRAGYEDFIFISHFYFADQLCEPFFIK